MALVPTFSPDSVVAPTESPSTARANNYQRIDVEGADFGAQEFKALAGVGQDITGAGDVLAQRANANAELNNETNARNASTAAMGSIALKAADYFSKKGQDAVTAFPQFMADLNATSASAGDGMTNPAAKNMLGQAMAPIMRHYTEAAAMHMKTETVTGNILSSTSRIDELTNQAAVFRNDPVKMQSYIDGIGGEMQNLGQIQGWDPATLADKTHKAQSGAYQKVIEAQAIDNPLLAQRTFSAVRGALDATDALRISEFLKPKVEAASDRSWLSGQVNQTGAMPGNINPDKLWDAQEYQESRHQQFDQTTGLPLTSKAGAVGVAQLMPNTAMDMGKSLGVQLDTPEQQTAFMQRVGSDETYNRTLGRAYQTQMLQKYGDPTLATAAYNAGPSKVDAWLKANGDPRTGAISTADWIAKIPVDETRNYVQNITNRVGADINSGMLQKPDRNTLVSAAVASSPDFETQMRRANMAVRYVDLFEHRDAQAKADLVQSINNNIEPALHAGQDGVTIPEAQIRSTMDPEQAERTIANLKYTQMSGQLFKSISMATPDQVNDMRQDLISGQGIMSNMLKGKAALVADPLGNVPSHMAEATSSLGMTPQEQFLYQTHLNNLHGTGKIMQPDGSVSSLLQMSFEQNGKTYNIPTVWGGKQLSADDAIAKANEVGIDKFPSYGSEAEAEARYGKMHDFMDKDTGDFLAAHNSAAGPQADFKLRQQMAQELETRLTQRNEALMHDPASYIASNDPTVRASLQSALSGNDPQAMQKYAAATLASQARLGVPEGRQGLLPQPYIDNLVSKFKSEDPSKEDPGLVIQNMAQQFGPYWPKVYGELVTKGKMPDEAAVTAILDAPGQQQVRQDYVRAWQSAAALKGDKKFDDLIGGQDRTAINTGLDDALKDFRNTVMVPGVSAAQNADAYGQMHNGVKMLATYYTLQGMDGTSALRKAVDGVVNQKWDLGNTYRTPKGMIAQTESAMNQVAGGLTADNVRDPGAIPGSKEAALDPDKRTQLFVGGQKLWVNNEAGDGVVMRVRGRDGSVMPIYTKDGQRVELKFADIAKQATPPALAQPAMGGAAAVP